MKILENAPQGSAAWHAARATRFCASEAAAAMGVSKYMTRSALLKQKATGIAEEVTPAKQRLFDAGHASEASALAIAESIANVEFFPAVGIAEIDGLDLLASYDGIDMPEEVIWENKLLNRSLVEQVAAGDLEAHYWAQIEQQLLVSGARRALFTTSDGTPEGTHHLWYESVPERRAQVIAAWKQFAADLAAYVPAAAPIVEKIVAESVESLPAPFVQVTGELSLQDNFKVFEDRLRDFLDNRLIREPKTDEDFVNLDAQIKAMKQGREALKSAKAQMLAQVQPVDQANKAADMLDKMLQQNCKMAEDLLTAEKERRRGEIVAAGVKGVQDHISVLNQRLGKPYMPQVQADFGGAIKGLKSLASMEDRVGTELARVKIEASGIADRIQINLATLREQASAHAFLFPDTAQIVLKAPDDLATLVTSRIAEHKAAEAKKEEAQRERIAAEERAKAEATVRAEQEQKRREQEAQDAELRQRAIDAEKTAQAGIAEARQDDSLPAPLLDELSKTAVTLRADVVSSIDARRAIAVAQQSSAAPTTHPTLSLGQIKERIAPLQITAEGMATLGFTGLKERGSVLYHEAEFGHMLAAMVDHLQAIHAKRAA